MTRRCQRFGLSRIIPNVRYLFHKCHIGILIQFLNQLGCRLGFRLSNRLGIQEEIAANIVLGSFVAIHNSDITNTCILHDKLSAKVYTQSSLTRKYQVLDDFAAGRVCMYQTDVGLL